MPDTQGTPPVTPAVVPAAPVTPKSHTPQHGIFPATGERVAWILAFIGLVLLAAVCGLITIRRQRA
ncbi:LPXTG cell wall anchor domain-containing protein [Lacticaseibacillus pantheris]